jgi:hypothetical protein
MSLELSASARRGNATPKARTPVTATLSPILDIQPVSDNVMQAEQQLWTHSASRGLSSLRLTNSDSTIGVPSPSKAESLARFSVEPGPRHEVAGPEN